MKRINYLLQGFGFEGVDDFWNTLFKHHLSPDILAWLGVISAVLGAVRYCLGATVGFDLPVFVVFVLLIVAEYRTGVKVSRQVNGEKWKSRKAGRMIAKTGVYFFIFLVLNLFSKGVDIPPLFGFEINPLRWLYFAAIIYVMFQFLVSYLENLSCLGYQEAGGLRGFLLRKFNKWFEFNGEKDNGAE